MMVQPALPASQRVVRHAVARWLEGAHWPEDGVEDITVAVTEAVTNVIEHAYLDHDPGAIHLYAWITPMADPALITAARPTTPDGRPAFAAPPRPRGARRHEVARSSSSCPTAADGTRSDAPSISTATVDAESR